MQMLRAATTAALIIPIQAATTVLVAAPLAIPIQAATVVPVAAVEVVEEEDVKHGRDLLLSRT